MFSLLDLRFVLCSRDLHVLRAQRIIGFFNLNYPQINEVGKYDHVTTVGEPQACDICFPFVFPFNPQKGLDVVYESIGGEMFDTCLDR